MKPIHFLAVDSNIVFYLKQYNDPDLDPNGLVHIFMDSTRRGDLVKMMMREKYSNLPPLLKIEPFNYIKNGDDGEKYLDFLCNISSLDYLMKRGIIELFVTPTVLAELTGLEKKLPGLLSFVAQNFTIVAVKNEDLGTFKQQRSGLAKEYVRTGAMLGEYDKDNLVCIPDSDAYIAAEGAVLGLGVLTANEIHFIHSNIEEKDDFKRQNQIYEINKKFGYIFPSTKEGKFYISQPQRLSTVVTKIKHKNYESARIINIDEHGFYTKTLKD